MGWVKRDKIEGEVYQGDVDMQPEDQDIANRGPGEADQDSRMESDPTTVEEAKGTDEGSAIGEKWQANLFVMRMVCVFN